MSSVFGQLNVIFLERGESYEYSSAEFIEEQKDFSEVAERAYAAILGREPDFSMLLSAFDDDAHLQYEKNFSTEWRRLGPLLEKYSRGVKLAPYV